MATTKARLREHYTSVVLPALVKEFGYKNVMAVPKIEKISINLGMGEATSNSKVIDGAVAELTSIAGQKPIITKAKKSIAAFKLREGMPIGVAVTLRGDRMFEFFDRLVTVALPRVRDFRGVSAKSFDGRGNYTLGIKDQLIFPEIDYNKVDKARGMNINMPKDWRCSGTWACHSPAPAARANNRLGQGKRANGNNRENRER
jgi:large subunit ribosomal protein L5